MSRTCAYILLLLLSFQTAAIWVLPGYRIQELKAVNHSRKQRPEDNIQIRLDAVRFARSRSGSHEIWIEGNLYDIQSIEYHGETVALSLSADHQEQGLLEWMREAVFQSTRSTAQHPISFCSSLLQLVQSLYLPVEKPQIKTPVADRLMPLKYVYAAMIPARRSMEVLAPPPECRS